MLVNTIFTVGVVFATFLQCCYCDIEHGTFGSDNKLLYKDEIYKQTSRKPQNLTIVFKYIGSEASKKIQYAKFYAVNTPINGSLEVMQNDHKEKQLTATLNVVNGTTFSVWAEIFSSAVTTADQISMQVQNQYGLGKPNLPKTMTIVYKHNSTKTRNRCVNLGQRQPGDKKISFETKNVTFSYRFPEAEFKFDDSSKFITSVGFSFDSPTAIAFINSSYITEHKINAIAYDLNTPEFEANMTVYGYDSSDKPSTYLPIVKSGKSKSQDELARQN